MNPFPVHLFPEPLRSFVTEGAAALDCDVAYIAVPLLPVLASAIGNARRIRLKQTWSEPAVIWAATVGESGTVKSPALELATMPLWRRQSAMLRAHSEERAQYETDLQRWKETPKRDRDAKPEAPEPCEHPICSDITVEALADRLLATPRGTLVAVDELAGWFGSFNQYKSAGADVAHWLSMHGARALKVDRKTGDKPTIYVPYAAVSLTGTIQPDTLRRVLLPEFFDNGLAARLLVAMPQTRAKRWTNDEISDATLRDVDDVFNLLFALKPATGPDGDVPQMVDLTPDALDEWARFVDEHGAQMQDLAGHERAAAAKLEAYAARFALVIHCARQATGAKDCQYVDADEISAGIELARWFGVETMRVYRSMSESNEDREQRELLQWIASRGGRVTVRDLQRNLRRYEHDPQQAELDLNDLVDRSYGSWNHVGGGRRGHPTQVFCMAAHPDFPFQSPQHAGADTNAKRNGKSAFPSASAVSAQENGAIVRGCERRNG